MLNFQIRGYGINLFAGTIDNDRLQGLLNKMRDNKSSLAQVMYDDNWRKFSNIIESRSPMITNDGELIITSYNSKDYDPLFEKTKYDGIIISYHGSSSSPYASNIIPKNVSEVIEKIGENNSVISVSYTHLTLPTTPYV